MAWTPLKTWAYKESLASNDMNTYVKDNLSYLKDTLDALLPTGIMWIWPTDTAPTGYLLCRGQAISRTTYSALFAVIGTTYGVGDNSTTFNLPNGAGKMFVGKDSTDALFDTLGETGGATTSSALIAHTHTGTTGTESADHSHSGTTGNISADHSHTFSGTTSGHSANHTHGKPDNVDYLLGYDSGGGAQGNWDASGNTKVEWCTATAGASNDHTHTYSGTTSGVSSNHTHNFTSGGRSAAHTHSFTSNSSGSGSSYSIMNPYQVVNYIIKY